MVPLQDKYIEQQKVLFDPASLADPFGKVFHYNGEVYRTVNPESEPLSKLILEKQRKWEKFGLVKTERASFILEGYPLILWHEKIKYRNYCMEWLPEMFKDAALMFLELNLCLIKDGFVCKDAHPWNIFFNFSKPIYIDIGSIVSYSQESFNWNIAEFKLYFLLPLVLFEKKGPEITYEFLRQPIPNHQYRENIAAEILDNKYAELLKLTDPEKIINELICYIGTLMVNSEFITIWGNYDQKEVPLNNPHKFIPKQKVVYDFLSTLPKSDILDIGCNSGWFSLLAHSLGHSVVSIDNDIPSVTRLYRQAKKGDLSILTLYADIKNLSRSHGLNNVYPSFEDRMCVDVVLAMAVIHHLSYTAKMSFDEVAFIFSKLTNKYLVIEFIPKEDLHVSLWVQENMEWYSRDNFIYVFTQYFKNYKVFKSSPEPREVFIFSKC